MLKRMVFKNAKTILSLMVRSIAEKYQDAVAPYTVEKLDTEKLYNAFTHVPKQISMCNLYSLHSISVDNHAINSSLYYKLCGIDSDNSRMYSKELQTFFKPFKSTPERVYLMLDMTHNL